MKKEAQQEALSGSEAGTQILTVSARAFWDFNIHPESGNYKNRRHVSEEVKDLLHNGGKLCLLEQNDSACKQKTKK